MSAPAAPTASSWSRRKATSTSWPASTPRSSVPRHLAFTWGWETTGTRGHETEVDITLDPHPEGCFLRLRHSNFESDTALAGHRGGWSEALDRLVECLAQPDA